MDALETKICFKRSVRILFKFYQFFGLVNFTYNRVTKRVESSTHKQCRFFCALLYCCLSSLALTFIFVAVGAVIYYVRSGITYVLSEEFLLSTRVVFTNLNPFIFTISFFTHRGTFVKTLNQLIVLSERVQLVTGDGSLYYPGTFRKFIYIRIWLFAIGCIVNICCGTVITAFGGLINCVVLVHSFTLMELAFWAHLYGNLTLMCFYQKMDTLLSVFCAAGSQRKIKRRIWEIISISFEIHRLKQKFNKVFNTLHVVFFLGSFNDINSIYELLKILVIVGLGKVHMPAWKIVYEALQLIFGRFSASLNFYLCCHIAETLVHTERLFRRKILTVFYASDDLLQDPGHRREIELVLMHHNIQDITTRSFKLFMVNRGFLFTFFIDLVICYAVVTLQQFVGEFFSASGHRLDVLQRSVAHTLEQGQLRGWES